MQKYYQKQGLKVKVILSALFSHAFSSFISITNIFCRLFSPATEALLLRIHPIVMRILS